MTQYAWEQYPVGSAEYIKVKMTWTKDILEQFCAKYPFKLKVATAECLVLKGTKFQTLQIHPVTQKWFDTVTREVGQYHLLEDLLVDFVRDKQEYEPPYKYKKK